ncbi:hypothetical protein [Saccharophagus degradans]|uniref:Cytochrome c domain-containing protein n=1 Tax=Saccharophagus degradans (strain 2-40 / ATCC 43961 / DSM 17024) TaxID=203122 RepID=Q21FK7_SACD2|nr:hypothetical protein [Saccharophagus degradans]ABD82522.1 hypothetical protein Sde_3267 [Saccharophagus degradans 2-40]
MNIKIITYLTCLLLNCVISVVAVADVFASSDFAEGTNKTEQVNNSYSKQAIRQKLFHSGGQPVPTGLCPKTIYDTIVPLPQARNKTLDMSIIGIEQFIAANGIQTIEQLLNYLPVDYRTNFSLVEHTRATGESNLTWPRIVLFGADGKFLFNIGTKPDDPKYNLLDVGFLDERTGEWEFSVFDFSLHKPQLIRNDASCAECHGNHNARPVWGTNLDWPGVFGDNIAQGPQGEALDAKHAERMNEIRAGEGDSPRFDFLLWQNQKLKRGAKRKIAHHVFGAELLLSNIAMGSATARGAFIRLQNAKPALYRQARLALLLAYYVKKGNSYLTAGDTAKLTAVAQAIGAKGMTLGDLLQALGVDINEAFSLATLAAREPPQPDWSMGAGDLTDMLMLQVLDDVRRYNRGVDNLLANRSANKGIIDCPQTANTVSEIITFKMLHLFYLTGQEKYEISRVYYPLDIEDIYSRVFLPVSHQLITYLKQP